MSLENLKRLAESLPERRGWDFSAVRDDGDPVPWSYREVARRYLSPLQRVLDIGTGGGEQFLALAEQYGSGVGIDADPEMVAIAEENTPQAVTCRVKFLAMDTAALTLQQAPIGSLLGKVVLEDVCPPLRG